jgi:phage terminase large subunit-like protein
MAAIKIIPSTKTMFAWDTGSVFRAVSAEVGTKFGLNPNFVAFDELAQAKSRDLYDAFDTSFGARQEPLFIVISTQSNDPQHPLSTLIDDGLSGRDPTTVCHLYAVPDDAKEALDDEKLWKLANPALGDFRSLTEMRTAAKRAKRMPSFEPAFRNLYLNQRVDAHAPLIARASWEGCIGDSTIQPMEKVYLGLDLSSTTDLTALVMVSDGEQHRVQPWFWKPADMIYEHEKRDRVPYKVWADTGHLELCPGKSIDYGWVAKRIAEICAQYEVMGMAFDRWRIDRLLKEMKDIGLDVYEDGKEEPRSGAIRLVPWGQGWKDMGPAIDALESVILDKKLVHGNHAILNWNISNAIAVSDPAGNRKLDKGRARFRIDGTQALCMALGLKSRDLLEIPEPSIYETRGVVAF